MPKELLDFGLQAAQGAVGAGMGLLLQKGQDRRQINQQRKLQDLEIGGQKQMTDYNFQKQLEMWKATNYQAQIAELQKAGLNPGMIYGMGGAGGATTGIESGKVTGGHAPVGGGEATTMAMTAAQMGLLRAQKENIEADTANKQADIPVKGSTKTKLDTETKGLELTNEWLKKTLDDRIDIINTEMNRQIEELDIAIGRKEEERGTRAKRIEAIRAAATGELLKNVLIEAQTKATNQTVEESKARIEQMSQQINKWAQEISQAWTNLDRNERELALKQWEAEIKASFPGLGQALGRMINGAMEQMSRGLGMGPLPKYEAPKKKQ